MCLIDYPPDHSKYNPIERCWAALENYWNGALLNTVEDALAWAANMTWKGIAPGVQLIEGIYPIHVSVPKAELVEYEQHWQRSETLPKWDVLVTPSQLVLDFLAFPLPQLLDDIRAIAEPQTQAAPSLTSQRLYTRLSAAEVRRQLIAQKGCQEPELPTEEGIRQRLNQLGYRLQRVAKTKPQKVIAETEAIFAAVNRINQLADDDEHTVRLSMDAKMTVNIGDYERGGKKSDVAQPRDEF